MADIDTPVSAFLKLERGDTGFLLESVEGGETLGRYSFIGLEPFLTISGKNGTVRVSGEIEETIRRLVKESGDLRLTGVCCINADEKVSDEKITCMFETVKSLREETIEK